MKPHLPTDPDFLKLTHSGRTSGLPVEGGLLVPSDAGGNSGGFSTSISGIVSLELPQPLTSPRPRVEPRTRAQPHLHLFICIDSPRVKARITPKRDPHLPQAHPTPTRRNNDPDVAREQILTCFRVREKLTLIATMPPSCHKSKTFFSMLSTLNNIVLANSLKRTGFETRSNHI